MAVVAVPTGTNESLPVGRASRVTLRPDGSAGPRTPRSPVTVSLPPGRTAGCAVRIDRDVAARSAASACRTGTAVTPAAVATTATVAAVRRRAVRLMGFLLDEAGSLAGVARVSSRKRTPPRSRYPEPARRDDEFTPSRHVTTRRSGRTAR